MGFLFLDTCIVKDDYDFKREVMLSKFNFDKIVLYEDFLSLKVAIRERKNMKAHGPKV